MVSTQQPSLAALAIATGLVSGIVLAGSRSVGAETVSLAFAPLAMIWTAYAFFEFGRRGLWVLVVALPSLWWPIFLVVVVGRSAFRILACWSVRDCPEMPLF